MADSQGSFSIDLTAGRVSPIYNIGPFDRVSYVMVTEGRVLQTGGSAPAVVTPQVSNDGRTWTALAVLDWNTHAVDNVEIRNFSQLRFLVTGAESDKPVRISFNATQFPAPATP
jgi:hypothetical protein